MILTRAGADGFWHLGLTLFFLSFEDKAEAILYSANLTFTSCCLFSAVKLHRTNAMYSLQQETVSVLVMTIKERARIREEEWV